HDLRAAFRAADGASAKGRLGRGRFASRDQAGVARLLHLAESEERRLYTERAARSRHHLPAATRPEAPERRRQALRRKTGRASPDAADVGHWRFAFRFSGERRTLAP